MTVSAQVEARGPLFDGSAARKARQIMADVVRESVESGHTRLNQMLRPRPAGVYLSVQQARPGQASKGHYRRSVGERFANGGLRGQLHDGGVVYSSWLEGTSSRNRTTRFKGYASFRRTRDWLEKTAIPKVLRVHLAKFRRGLGGR